MRKLIQELAEKMSRLGLVLGMAVMLLLPQIAYSQAIEEDPSALAMAGDLLVARPLGVVATVAGTAIYLVSLPFSLAGGNAGEAGKTLVVGPARATFVRCLGCTRLGYKKPTPDYDE